jgi:hypothetical protein
MLFSTMMPLLHVSALTVKFAQRVRQTQASRILNFRKALTFHRNVIG